MGFTEEADSYMKFIEERLDARNDDGSINIMYSIHGSSDLEETTLNHMNGYKGSKPVRVGNGAANHLRKSAFDKC